MHLDIYFDTICPWCLIGKKRLEKALETRAHVSLKLRWKPYLLNPNMSPEGIDRQIYLQQKFGGAQRAKRVYDVIAQTGTANGIDFKFDDISITPNSIDSHRLVSFAEGFGMENAAVDRLFSAFFLEGKNIGDRKVLCELGDDIGLSTSKLIDFLESDQAIEEVRQSDRDARDLGVHGVPAFIGRDHYIISGAQEPKVLGKFIDTAWNG